MLKQGAKRTALGDVSNRVPVAPAQIPAGKRTSLVRTVSKENAVAAPLPKVFPRPTEDVVLQDIPEQDDLDMEVDSPFEKSSHAIALGAPVKEPVYTRGDKQELSRVGTEFVDDWDEWSDISMVQEYADEIFAHMHHLERKFTPNANYMTYQNELEWNMRSILIDWLVQVHARFHLLPETLFLTINYIDRFLSAKTVSLQKLQLVGATALFIASKYEEIQCPSVHEIVYMVDNGYDADEVLKAERFMIGMLGFELGWPGPMSFLRRISKADDYDIDTRTVAKYLLEAMLMSQLFVASPPSFSAAIADYLARIILNKEVIWTDAHVFFSTYTEAQVQPAVDILIRECLERAREKHAAIFDKYAEKKHKKVSLFVEAWLNKRLRGQR